MSDMLFVIEVALIREFIRIGLSARALELTMLVWTIRLDVSDRLCFQDSVFL